MAGEWTYNDVDVTAAPYYFEPLRIDRVALPEIRLETRGLGREDGAVVQGGALNPVEFVIEGSIAGANRAAVVASMDALLHLLGTRETAACSFTKWPGRYWNVRPIGAIEQEEIGEAVTGTILTIRLVAPDPLALDETETVKNFTILTNPDTFVIEAVDLASGNASAKPTFIIESGGLSYNIKIENETTGEEIQWNRWLPDGWFLKVDSLVGLIYCSADGITYDASMAGKSGVYPTLSPRVANTITVTGVSAGTLQVRFRERFK